MAPPRSRYDDDNNDGRRGYTASGGLVPVPDPTTLTTDALRREIGALREALEAKIGGQETVFSAARLVFDQQRVTIDHATTALRELVFSEISKLKTSTDENFKRIETQMNDRLSVISEVFRKVDVQFIERDKQATQLALSNSTAIAAAMQAAEKAVGAQNISNSTAIAKSESATTESLKQLRELFISELKGIRDQVGDIKTRQDKGEGAKVGGGAVWGYIVGAAGLVIAAATLVALVLRRG